MTAFTSVLGRDVPLDLGTRVEVNPCEGYARIEAGHCDYRRRHKDGTDEFTRMEASGSAFAEMLPGNNHKV